jgi:ELWxxDGT repeat protein
MRRVSFILCASYLALIVNSANGAPQFAVHRVGPLNPNFDADRPDSISDSSALFAPIGVLRNGRFDNTLGNILIYTTERFVNGSGNLGMEYTQVATNGRQIWNLETGNGELVGGAFAATEFDGHFYFTSDYNGLQKSDGVHAEPFLAPAAGPPFLGQGGVFKFQDRLLHIGTYQEDEFAPTHWGLFDATSGVAALLFDMFPNGQPFDIPNHRVAVVNDEILISVNGVGNMYRIQHDASNWSIQTVQFPSTPVQASLFTPLGSKVVFTNSGADGFEPHILQGSVATQIADINPGPAFANPFLLTPFVGKVIFSALGPSGREPYITDGETVQLLADLLPGSGDSDPRSFTVAGDRVYFSAIGAEGRQLYSSDGVDVVQVSHFPNSPLKKSFLSGLPFASAWR